MIIFLLLWAILQGSAVFNEPDRHFLLLVIREVELDCTDALFEPLAAPFVVVVILNVFFGQINGELATLPPDLSQVLLRVRLIKDGVDVI